MRTGSIRTGSPNGGNATSRERLGSRAMRWVIWPLLVLALLSVLVLTWMLRSGSGRDFALARVLATLPSGALSWETAEGTVSGPLVLHGLRYDHDGLVIEVERAVVDLAPGALLGRRLHIEQLTLERGRVVLPPGDATPMPWPRSLVLPDSLPELRLPLSIAVDALAVRDVRIEQGELPLLVMQQLDAIGSFERGRFALERLDLVSDRGTLRARGALDTSSRWDTGLHATLDLNGVGAKPLPLKIDAEGDLRDLRLTVTGNLPEPVLMKLRLRGGLPDPRWALTLDAPRVDPGFFGAEGEVLSLSLRGEGSLSAATISGDIARGTHAVRIEPSTLRYNEGVVHLEPVALILDPGRIEATGTIDLRESAPRMALDVLWRDLEFPAEVAANRVRTNGTARIDGPLSDYALRIDGKLTRSAVEDVEEHADLILRGRGSDRHVAFESLSLTTPRGVLEASGEVTWSPTPTDVGNADSHQERRQPQLSWKIDAALRGFDPAWFVPAFPGAVNATLTSEGAMIDDRAQGTLRLDPLGGTLRGRGLGGRIVATLDAEGGRGELALRLGESRLDGDATWGETGKANLRLNPLHLADLLPGAAGQLRGSVMLAGTQASPSLVAAINGDALAFEGYAAGTLRLRARLEAGSHGTFSLEASTVELAGLGFDNLSLVGSGTRAQHALTLALDGTPARMNLALEGGERDGRWRWTLRDLRIEPRERAAWTLREPSELEWNRAKGALRLTQSCLVLDAATFCAQADWSTTAGEASFAIDALPLATLDPFLSAALEIPASAYGTLGAEGRIARDRAGALQGNFSAESAAGGLRLDPESPRELLAYHALKVHGSLTPTQAQLRADAQLAKDGMLHAEFESSDPFAADGVLRGKIEARLRDLSFVELFSDRLVDLVGGLDAELGIEGTRLAPRLLGSAKLHGFGGEWPAFGLTLQDGEVTLRSRGTQAAAIEGSIVSGGGKLHIAGHFDAAPAAAETLELTLRGENVVVAAIPELSATMSPELVVSLIGDRLKLRGQVTVPTARIALERLQSATSPSRDIVMVDAAAVAAKDGTVFDSDVSVIMGDDVRLDGFGLKGKLEGKIAVRDRPGRATVARGALQVGGRYKAYGQNLTITRGRLAYAGTPLDDPALDIRAEREVDQVVVGVQVRGTALAPELTLWSTPALDQAEQLSYLVLGRPLRSASQADGAQLSRAAATFGGNLLAQKLGARMGLDEIGVADSRALGGAALTVGKFLSPRLFVSYGVALFGDGQVVTFKYLLSRLWNVQIDAGHENRAALNFELER